MSGKSIAFNGKFLSAPPTGVHRVAETLISGVDDLLSRDPDSRRWELVKPRDADRPLPLRNIPTRTVGRLTWQPWEQFELPLHVRGQLLVNLCNLAPLAVRGSVTMIHDAQVFISPESYSRAFRSWYQFALPRIGASAARVLTVSEYSKTKLVEYGVAPPEKIEVVYNGVDHLRATVPDPAILGKLGLAPESYVVALANTQKHKNIGLLLRAFAAPELADLKLVLVGQAGAPEFAAQGHVVPANAVFAGRISDAELAALYGSAICLAFPSTTEGFGLPPLEAMQAGCPAVAAPCGALPEICGDAAIYAEPDDPAAWVEAIARMAGDSELRLSHQALGSAQAARFTWANSTRQLMSLLRAVADA